MLIKIQSPLKLIRQKSGSTISLLLTSASSRSFYSQYVNLLSLFGGTKKIDCTNISGQVIAYNSCAPVNGSISKIQESARNGRWMITDKDGNESNKATPLRDLIAGRPNPIQTWTDFISNVTALVKLFGWCICLPSTAAGFGKNGTYSLMVVPNWMIDEVKYTGKLWSQNSINDLISYFRIGQTQITPDKLIIFQDSQISMNTDGSNFLLPQSRLYPLTDQVSNIVQAYEARYTLMAKKGAIGILSNESKDSIGTLALTPEEKKAIQDEWALQYGLSPDQSQIVITSQNLKWQSMTFPTKDLMLFEEIKDDALALYDAFGVPVFLTPFSDQTTFTNLNAAEKRFYTTTVIPACENIAQALANYFELEAAGLELRVYFDHLEIFQKSKKEEAEALKAMTDALDNPFAKKVITKLEYRLLIADFMPEGSPFDPENPQGDEYMETPQPKPIITPAPGQNEDESNDNENGNDSKN